MEVVSVNKYQITKPPVQGSRKKFDRGKVLLYVYDTTEAVLWILIRIPIKLKGRIRIRSEDKLDPDLDPHQFADDKPKCMEYEPI
jgi:hypothetical protein